MVVINPEVVLVLMLHQLMQINGEPTHKKVKVTEKEIQDNLIAISCPRGLGKGHLGIPQDPAVFLHQNRVAYMPSLQTPHAYTIIPIDINATSENGAAPRMRMHNKPDRCSYTSVAP